MNRMKDEVSQENKEFSNNNKINIEEIDKMVMKLAENRLVNQKVEQATLFEKSQTLEFD